MEGSYLSGLLHTLTGLDHLLVILSFSIMLGLSVQTKLLSWIGAVVLVFMCSILAGQSGPALGFVESVITVTLVAGGVLLFFRPLSADLRLLALFGAIVAISHGYAHGMEAPASGLGFWLLGAVSAFAGMMSAGILATRWVARPIAERQR
jgi:urease accessory protein